MSWLNYYYLLEKYNGDLSKATKKEMESAARSNPNNPYDARDLAEKNGRRKKKKRNSNKFIKFFIY